MYEGTKSNIIGLVLVKSLILLDPDAGLRARDICRSVDAIPRIQDNMPLYDLLNKFQEGKSQYWCVDFSC